MESFEQVHQLICRGLEQGAYPSAALAIGIGDTLYFKKTYGNCTEDTIFDIASLSKILSPTMIAFRFLEDGLLRLYDTVADYFPEAPEDKKAITIGILQAVITTAVVTHTSGIADHFYLSDYTSDPQDAAKVILERPLVQAPGTGPIYSCMGYILLGKILEKIGGAPLDRLAQEYVYAPLSMHHTGYHPSGDIAPTEINPETGTPFCGVVHDENARFLGGVSANAGIFSNLGDMIIFTKMLGCGGKREDGFPYLSPAMLRAAIVNRTPHSTGEFRGLGFNLAGSPKNFLGDLMGPRTFGHTGFTGTSIAVDPDTGL